MPDPVDAFDPAEPGDARTVRALNRIARLMLRLCARVDGIERVALDLARAAKRPAGGEPPATPPVG